MTDRGIVIDLLSKLPGDTSLEEIAREIELLAGSKANPPMRRVFRRRILASSAIDGLASNSDHPAPGSAPELVQAADRGFGFHAIFQSFRKILFARFSADSA